jgi:FtsZ-binding cell division protein ZapB
MKMVAPQLLELTMEQNQQLKNEVADLKGKNELLRVENGNLHSKNIELRDKLSVIRVIAS